MTTWKWTLTKEQRKAVWKYIDTNDYDERGRQNDAWYSDGAFKSEACGETAAEAFGFTEHDQIVDCIVIAQDFEQLDYIQNYALRG